MKIYTIGYKGKGGAESFFERIKAKHIDLVIDVREKNTSQLVGFSKYPDVKFFLECICGCNYVHEPTYTTYLSSLKNESARNNILKKYGPYGEKSVCIMSSEEKSAGDSRESIAAVFAELFNSVVEDL